MSNKDRVRRYGGHPFVCLTVFTEGGRMFGNGALRRGAELQLGFDTLGRGQSLVSCHTQAARMALYGVGVSEPAPGSGGFEFSRITGGERVTFDASGLPIIDEPEKGAPQQLPEAPEA